MQVMSVSRNPIPSKTQYAIRRQENAPTPKCEKSAGRSEEREGFVEPMNRMKFTSYRYRSFDRVKSRNQFRPALNEEQPS